MKRAVIFDMDGVLIDSEPYWRKAHQLVLANMGYIVTDEDVRQAAGKRTIDQVVLWRERFQFAEPNDEQLAQEIAAEVASEIKREGAPMPGLIPLIRDLHNKGIPMAVASSSSMDLIKTVLDRLDIRQYITVLHSAENEKRGKPFPDVFLAAAKSLSIQASDCVVIEDSVNGILAAKAAGMFCIAVPEPGHDIKKLNRANPDRIATSLSDIDANSLMVQ